MEPYPLNLVLISVWTWTPPPSLFFFLFFGASALDKFWQARVIARKKLAIKGERNEAFARRLFTVRPRRRNQVKQPLWCVSAASTEWKPLQPLWRWGRSSPSIDGFHMLGFYFFIFFFRLHFCDAHLWLRVTIFLITAATQGVPYEAQTCWTAYSYLCPPSTSSSLQSFSHITPFLFSGFSSWQKVNVLLTGSICAPIEITLMGDRSLSLVSALRSPSGYRRKTCGRRKEKGRVWRKDSSHSARIRTQK